MFGVEVPKRPKAVTAKGKPRLRRESNTVSLEEKKAGAARRQREWRERNSVICVSFLGYPKFLIDGICYFVG